MSELREHLWAVISERGREAAGLTHAEAARLVRELSGARVRGLCVVTDGTARHLPQTEEAGGRGSEVSQADAGRRA